MVVVRFWSVLPERRPMHLLEEPEDGAELGGGAIRAFSELVGVRRRRLAELQGDFFHQCRIAVFLIKPTFSLSVLVGPDRALLTSRCIYSRLGMHTAS